MRSKRSVSATAVLLATLFFAFLSHGIAAPANESIRLGYSIALTGVNSAAAQSVVESYAVWEEIVNKRGGIYVKEYGKKLPVKMVYYDDQSDPGTAVRIYEKLLTQDKVDLLLPPWGTPTHFAVAPLAQKYKVPIVGGTAASVKLRELRNEWFWFVSWMPDSQERAIVDLLKDLKVKSAAVAYVQEIFPKENLQFLEPYLREAGISTILLKDYPVAEKDLKTLLSQIKATNPDAVICLSYPPDTMTIVTQAQEVGLNPKFMFGLVGPGMLVFKPKFGPAVEGISTMGNWTPRMKAYGNREFVQAYETKYKQSPDPLDSVLGYVPCQIMEQAIEKVGSLDRQKLRECIASSEFQSIQGPVKFKGSENAAAVAGVLQWQKGAMEIIWPKSIATAAPIYPKPAWPK